MNIRQKMVKERRDILEKMDDATLAGSISGYFVYNTTMPGEGWLKKDAEQLITAVESNKNNPDFDINNLYTDEKRAAALDKFADVSIKDVRLKNPALTQGMSLNDMVFPKGEDLGGGKTRYVLYGEIDKTSTKVFFGNGVMNADIPYLFLKNHPEVAGNVMIEATDYSNGKGKNVTYDMYVDLMRGSDFDRELEQKRFTPHMDANIMFRINDKFEAYVPNMGKAPTVGGEMVRAMSRIGYRYLNDGDKLNDGYGRETVNPAARFLMEKGSDDVKDALKQMWAPYTPYNCDYYSDDHYETMLTNLGKALMEQFDKHPELFTTPNKEDMFDYTDVYEDRDDSFDEEEGDDDYYEDEEDEEEDDYDDFSDAIDSIETEEGFEM